MKGRTNYRLYSGLVLVMLFGFWILSIYIGGVRQNPGDISPEVKRLMVGFVIGAPLVAGLLLLIIKPVTDKRPGVFFLLAALLNSVAVFSGWITACLAAVAGILMFTFSAYLQRDLYDGSFTEAFKHLGRLAFGNIRGDLHIDDGKIISPTSTLPVMGPRHLIIAAGNAVVIKARESGKPPRVLFRAGTIEGQERVVVVYDLRNKQMTLGLDDVVSKDYVTFIVQASAEYGINVSSDAKDGKAVTGKDAEVILSLTTAKPDWESATQRAFERGIRQMFGEKSIDGLMRTLSYSALEQKIQGRVTAKTQVWGVIVHGVIIQRVQMHTEVTAAKEREWIRYH